LKSVFAHRVLQVPAKSYYFSGDRHVTLSADLIFVYLPSLVPVYARAQRWTALYRRGKRQVQDAMLTIIERVLLLQNIDLFSHVTAEQVSFFAALAEENVVGPGQVLYRRMTLPTVSTS